MKGKHDLFGADGDFAGDWLDWLTAPAKKEIPQSEQKDSDGDGGRYPRDLLRPHYWLPVLVRSIGGENLWEDRAAFTRPVEANRQRRLKR